jgi:hypothetical protein
VGVVQGGGLYSATFIADHSHHPHPLITVHRSQFTENVINLDLKRLTVKKSLDFHEGSQLKRGIPGTDKSAYYDHT